MWIFNKPRIEKMFIFTILFVRNMAEVEKWASSTIEQLEYDSYFWVAYPKGTSSIKSDINRDKLVELFKPFGYRPVSLICMDSD